MTLQKYFFPVVETDVYYDNMGAKYTGRYKGIIRTDTNDLISIVSNDYKLIPNEQLINSVLETLDKTDIRYNINDNPKHSYVDNKRMRLHLTFPDLHIQDDSAEGIDVAMYIHNSYDTSERVRIIFGMLRLVCTNGAKMWMPYNTDAKFNRKHTQGLNLEKLRQQFDTVYHSIPEIQERIRVLDMLDKQTVIGEAITKVKDSISVTMAEEAEKANPQTMWQLYNLLTAYVTHQTAVRQHAEYQRKISNLFHI